MNGKPRQEVFLLWHDHRFDDGFNDELLVGVFRTKEGANAAAERLRGKQGFADCADAFSIATYELDKNYWPEGYCVDGQPNLRNVRNLETLKPELT